MNEQVERVGHNTQAQKSGEEGPKPLHLITPVEGMNISPGSRPSAA
jgi:hypothetical protein